MFDFAFELLRQPAGQIVWSKNFPGVDIDDPAQMQRISRSLAQTIGDAYGVVDLDALRHLVDFDGVPRGFNCTLCAFSFMKTQTVDRLRVARNCLELAVKTNPRDAGAKALLAILLVHFHVYGLPESAGDEDLSRAEQLAQAAYALEPNRARSTFALFVTRFYAKRFDESFRLAGKTLELNPNSSLFTRVIGAARIARADYDPGLALLAPVREDPGDSSAAVGSIALAAYMRNDFAAAADLLGRPGASDRALGLILQIALCGKHSDAFCARSHSEKLRQGFPGVAGDIDAAFDRAAFADPIRKSLSADLGSAGFFAPGGE
jgi:tetratricopeptide (TPR) repeat protein